MVDLSEKLRNIIGKISSLVNFSDKEINDIVKDLQRTLLQADVDVDIVFELSNNIKEKAKKDPEAGISKREFIIKLIYDELVEILGGEGETINIEHHSILLLGLFGSGKTSLAGKLANFYKNKGMKVVVIGCDFSRPMAFEQLKQIANSIKIPIINGKDLKEAKTELEKQKADLIIIDSAGRNALDKDMAKELKRIDSLFEPEERYLVIPAELGQDARRQVEEFKKSVNITGVVVTKMDSIAKGGATLTACKTSGAKVRFLGIGENVTDLENYNPTRFVSKLLGFGDLQGLLDKFKIKEEEVKKMSEGKLDLNSFYQQINEIQKQGSMKKMLDMIPGFGKMKLPKGAIEVGEKKIKKWKYLIDSMTKGERKQPEILKSSRVLRVAKGSGTKVQEVNELINNFKKMKKTMKKMNSNKMKKFGGMLC